MHRAIALGVRGQTTPEQTADGVTLILAQSYCDRVERVVATTDSLMREEFAIRTARLKTLQRQSTGICTVRLAGSSTT